jgi:orotidine-5'-phosphate decarboxylase
MTASPDKRIIIPLDRVSVIDGLRLASKFASRPGFWGVKLTPAFFAQLCLEPKPKRALDTFAEIGGIMADFKLHDIPTTVADCVSSIANFSKIITAHTLGGEEMMIEATKAAAEHTSNPDCMIAGVTILTSHDTATLKKVGLDENTPISERVLQLARLAYGAGAGAIVCSAAELQTVRQVPILKIVPGIRLPKGNVHDQKRIGTPDQAIRDGAGLLVVGRAITEAENPLSALEECHELVTNARMKMA